MELTKSARIAPLLAVGFGLLSVFFLRDISEGIVFLGAAAAQFTAFVFVSRFRQRGSFFWHIIASLASNGTWFMTMHALDLSGAYILLILPYVAGMIAGRTAGVVSAQYVERKYNLVADATRDGRLVARDRWSLILREPSFHALWFSLVTYCLYGTFQFTGEMLVAMYVVVGLGIAQNFFYALSARANNRGNSVYIAITSLFAGSIFYISAVYLFAHDVSWMLFIPYMLSTALGSTSGAFFSMLIEAAIGLAPDKHLTKGAKNTETQNNRAVPYVVIIVLVCIWIVGSEYILKTLGFTVTQTTLPFWGVVGRESVFLVFSCIFLLNNALHAVVSRAGNRDHTLYHISTMIPKGIVDFLVISYLALNTSIVDIIPIAILSGSLGALIGKDIGEFVEKKLQARMDVQKAVKT